MGRPGKTTTFKRGRKELKKTLNRNKRPELRNYFSTMHDKIPQEGVWISFTGGISILACTDCAMTQPKTMNRCNKNVINPDKLDICSCAWPKIVEEDKI